MNAPPPRRDPARQATQGCSVTTTAAPVEPVAPGVVVARAAWVSRARALWRSVGVVTLVIVLAATLAWPAPGAAQGQSQGRGAVPPGGLAPLQSEPGDIWAEVRAWESPRRRGGAQTASPEPVRVSRGVPKAVVPRAAGSNAAPRSVAPATAGLEGGRGSGARRPGRAALVER